MPIHLQVCKRWDCGLLLLSFQLWLLLCQMQRMTGEVTLQFCMSIPSASSPDPPPTWPCFSSAASGRRVLHVAPGAGSPAAILGLLPVHCSFSNIQSHLCQEPSSFCFKLQPSITPVPPFLSYLFKTLIIHNSIHFLCFLSVALTRMNLQETRYFNFLFSTYKSRTYKTGR